MSWLPSLRYNDSLIKLVLRAELAIKIFSQLRQFLNKAREITALAGNKLLLSDVGGKIMQSIFP
jgi:hypothetical protein